MADGSDTMLSGKFDQLSMGGRCRGDIHEVDVLTGEKLASIEVGTCTEFSRCCLRPLTIDIAHGHDVDLGHAGPRVQVILGKEARPDDGHTEGGVHNSTGRDGSVIHSLHDPTYMRAPSSPAIVMARTFWAAVMPEPQ